VKLFPDLSPELRRGWRDLWEHWKPRRWWPRKHTTTVPWGGSGHCCCPICDCSYGVQGLGSPPSTITATWSGTDVLASGFPQPVPFALNNTWWHAYPACEDIPGCGCAGAGPSPIESWFTGMNSWIWTDVNGIVYALGCNPISGQFSITVWEANGWGGGPTSWCLIGSSLIAYPGCFPGSGSFCVLYVGYTGNCAFSTYFTF